MNEETKSSLIQAKREAEKDDGFPTISFDDARALARIRQDGDRLLAFIDEREIERDHHIKLLEQIVYNDGYEITLSEAKRRALQYLNRTMPVGIEGKTDER